jgi:poly(3-hydroxybutyrate) depolymerase
LALAFAEKRLPKYTTACLCGRDLENVSVAGRERTCLVHVPPRYDPAAPILVVLAFHGGGANAEKMVAFTCLVLDDLERVANVDRRRVFAKGMSNGATMSFRLAMELSDRIRGLLEDIDGLLKHGGVHAKHRGFHRMMSCRFPFAIFYDVNGDAIDIYAVLDCRQDPEPIDERLEAERLDRSDEA